MSTGMSHTCGLKTDGRLFYWGGAEKGRLGQGRSRTFVIPEPIDEQSRATDWADISAGTTHACGIKSDGRLYCWGDGRNGQLGSELDGGMLQNHKARHAGWVGTWDGRPEQMPGFIGAECYAGRNIEAVTPDFAPTPSVGGNCLNACRDCCVAQRDPGGLCSTPPYRPVCDFGLSCGSDPLWCPEPG